jgi:hypothetical protein
MKSTAATMMKGVMVPTRTRALFVVLLCLSKFQKNRNFVHGYAAWLKCFVELDPSEVIMNHLIVPYDKADIPGVELELKAFTTEEELNEPLGWVTGEYTYSVTTTTQPIHIAIRLRIPEAAKTMFVQARRDVQWVLETTMGAKFVYSEACKGTRGYAQRDDDKQILKILIGESNLPESIELIAGWATGHEAVTLTPKLILKQLKLEQEL